MTLRVAVDATPLLDPPTGVGVLARAVVAGLAARPGVEPVAFAVTWRGRERLPAAVPEGVVVAARPMAARPLRALWRRLGRPRIEAWTGPVDVVHGPNFVVPPSRAPRLVTVHDLTAVRFPALCTPDVLQWPALVRRAVAEGAWVHTPSAFVADEVREHFAVDPDRVVAVPNGVDVVPEAPAGRGVALAGRPRYVLSVGTLEPRKDLPGLVRAFDAIAADDADLGLVLAGAEGWGAGAVRASVEAAAHRERIRLTGRVSDDDRAALLREAAVLAFPSRYEGFGLPPLEAMSVGVPVVTTAAGAVPEVVGDAAVVVPPEDPDALAEGLRVVLTDEGRRAELVERGRRRAAGFSWETTVDGLVDLYRRMAGRAADGDP